MEREKIDFFRFFDGFFSFAQDKDILRRKCIGEKILFIKVPIRTIILEITRCHGSNAIDPRRVVTMQKKFASPAGGLSGFFFAERLRFE